MKGIGVELMGRFGNQMFQYAYARAWAEREGRRLHTNPWPGQKVFTIDDPPLEAGMEMIPQEPSRSGYRQDQESLIYTRRQVKEWFAWRYDLGLLNALDFAAMACGDDRVLVHLRHGDYLDCGYPVIRITAALDAIIGHGLHAKSVIPVREESPWIVNGFEGELAFVPDFYRLMMAPILFRSNSSFSWWAATLGSGRVFAPVIEGLMGGVEHDAVPFVEGNWPRLCELEFVTDLHLKEE